MAGKYTQLDVLKTFMTSLDYSDKSGRAMLDDAVKACSQFTDIQAVIDQLVADCRSTNNATKFLKDYCGIDLSNTDTGAITGSDAGGSTSKTRESIVPERGSASYPTGTSFTANGLTITFPPLDTLTKDEQLVVRGMYSWWMQAALDLIETSYGLNFREASTSVREIELNFNNESGAFAWASVGYTARDGVTYQLRLDINMTKTVLDEKNQNGVSSTASGYFDRLLAHELTHAVMDANIKNFNTLPRFIREGAADLVHGSDDWERSAILSCAASADVLARYLDVDDTVTGSDRNVYAAGFIFLRYLARQAADNLSESNATILAGTSKNDALTNAKDNMLIVGNDGKDTVNHSGSGSTLVGGRGNDVIKLSGGGNLILYYMGDGNDTVQGFSETDTLEIRGGSYSTVASGKHVLVNVGTNKITLANFKGTPNIAVNTVESAPLDPTDKVVFNVDGDCSVIVGSGADTVINGGSNVIIDADSGNDSIVSSTPDVTIHGGVGDDLISLGADSARNVINYCGGDGNDTVLGANSTSTVRVNTAFSTVRSGTNLIVRVGSETITLKNAARVPVAFEGELLNPFVTENGKTIVAEDGFAGVLEAAAYPAATVLDASPDTQSVTLLGGGKVTTFRAGSNGTMMIGSTGKDSFYGGAGADTFVGMGGTDMIFGYDAAQGDIISLEGVELTQDNFRDSAGHAVLAVGDQKIYINGAVGKPIVAVSGDDTVAYCSLPGGIEYTNGKKRLEVGAEFNGTVDIADYVSSVVTIDASANEDALVIIGSKKTNVLIGGKGHSTLLSSDGADKLRGGSGADVFVCEFDGSADQIYNFDMGDSVSLDDVTRADLMFRDSKGAVVVTRLGDAKSKLTINKLAADVPIVFDLGGETFTYNSLPSGVGYAVKGNAVDYTRLVLEPENNVTVEAAAVNTQLKTLDASSSTAAINLVGNANANVMKLGPGGGTLDGGYSIDAKGVRKATADKYYGGSGEDVFVWDASTGGNDFIYDFDGRRDRIVISNGGSDLADKLVVKESGSNVSITLGSQKLTLSAPRNAIRIYDESGALLETYGIDLPEGAEYNAKRTALEIVGEETLAGIESQEFRAEKLSTTIKEMNASGYAGKVKLVGGGKVTTLRASSGGSTLVGGSGNEKFYGGSGADVFVYSVGGGSDQIFNFDATDIMSIGGATSDGLAFKDSKNMVTLTFAGSAKSKVTITKSNTTDGIRLALDDGVMSYGVLPTGVEFDDEIKKTGLKVGAGAADGVTVDASKIATTLKTLDGSAAPGAVELIGNDLANVLRAGDHGSTLYGGHSTKAVADKLYGGSGEDVFRYAAGDGNDVIYDYSTEDHIEIDGEIGKAAVSKQNVVLTVGNGKLTIDKGVGTTLTINGEKYLFDGTTKDDKKSGKTALESARENASGVMISNGQFPTEEYWFESESAASPLEAIVRVESPEYVSDELLSNPFKRSMLDVTGSLRRRNKK